MIKPPRWADKFLMWYCNPDILEEVQGDVHELYEKRYKTRGRLIAQWNFIWDVFRFLRWSNIKRNKNQYSSNSYIMIKSYFTIGIRSAVRHKLNSSINILGLSIALGISITTFIFIDNQLNTDDFNPNRDRIYQITCLNETDNRIDEWSDTPMPLAKALVKDHSIIEASTRIEFSNVAIRRDEVVFNEFIQFVDPEYIQFFNFPVLQGSTNALANKSEIMMETQIAEKYFGKTNPVGQIVSIKFNESHKEEFTIGGVFKRPSSSNLYPTVLISMEIFDDLHPEDANNWAYQTDATFIMLAPGHSPTELLESVKGYLELQNTASPQWLIKDYKFHSLIGLNLKSHEIISSVANGAHPSGLISLGVISALLLLLASFNYMNVSIATVTTRLKEIGIRKVIGGQKREIIQQFLVENFLLCALAMIAGLLLAYLLFLPGFNSLYPVNIPFAFSSGNTIFLFFGALLLFVGLISGAYPALYISSFTPITIMRGREKFGQRSLFSRILLTLQFVLAFMTIVGSFVFIDNSLYLKNKDWGYNHAQVMAIPVGDKEKYLALRDALVGNQNIEYVAGSANHIGASNTRANFAHLEQRYETVDFRIGFDYLETMDIRLKDGRFFDQTIQSDHVESVVVNEAFVEKLGWQNPIGQTFEFDSLKRYVIGVVEDFHYEGFYSTLGPVLFRVVPEEKFSYLTVKVKSGSLNETEDFIKKAWAGIAPDDPFEGYVQDRVFDDFNNDNNANVKLLGFVASTSLILASLGLFGLVSFNITRRMKEFSIRKVFGAHLSQIFSLMNRDYVWILLTAFLIGAPLGFYLTNMLIQQIYPDPQSARVFPFIIAVSVMAFTVALTVSTQLGRIRKENPASTLRND